MNDEGFQALANAIIIQACKDYRRALLILKQKDISVKQRELAEKTLKQTKKFFKSQYFTQLTKVDPRYLWEKLNEGV